MPKGQLYTKKAKKNGVKKNNLKQKKPPVAQKDGDAEMKGAPKVARESAHDLFKRHAAERKKAMAEVADLKKQRAKLPKKKSKEGKKAISKQIKDLIDGLKARHDQEKKSAGLDAEARNENGAESDDDAAISDDE